MNAYIKNCIYLIMGLGLVAATACNRQEALPDEPDMPGDRELCEVTVRLGTKNSEDSADPNARDGEYIHSLCLFIVNEAGKIEEKLHPDLSDNSDSQQGNLKFWDNRAAPLLLTPGKKKIYAFANWEKLTTIEERDLEEVFNALQPGDQFNVSDWVIQDPAAAINLDGGGFIPMSAQVDVEISSKQTVKVELVRLVARVDVEITNKQDGKLTLGEFTIQGLANQVGLMKAVQSPGVIDITRNLGSKTLAPGKVESFSFYVNETPGEKAYPIELKVNTSENYTGETRNITLLRNSILPLNLLLTNNDLELIVRAYLAPIGGRPYEAVVRNPGLDGTYVAELPEGCRFEVNARLKPKAGEGEEGTCVLSYYEDGHDYTSLVFLDNNSNTGHITSVSEATALLQVDFTSPSGKKASCILEIRTKGIEEFNQTGNKE